jgi:hypothetical protein
MLAGSSGGIWSGHMVDTWTCPRSVMRSLAGEHKTMIFHNKTYAPRQAYETTPQLVIASSLCSFCYSIYLFLKKVRLHLKAGRISRGCASSLLHCGWQFLQSLMAGFHVHSPPPSPLLEKPLMILERGKISVCLDMVLSVLWSQYDSWLRPSPAHTLRGWCSSNK